VIRTAGYGCVPCHLTGAIYAVAVTVIATEGTKILDLAVAKEDRVYITSLGIRVTGHLSRGVDRGARTRSYGITENGSLGGSQGSFTNRGSVNDSGQVTGITATCAFVTQNGSIEELNNLIGVCGSAKIIFLVPAASPSSDARTTSHTALHKSVNRYLS
jgi:hypothetical protein